MLNKRLSTPSRLKFIPSRRVVLKKATLCVKKFENRTTIFCIFFLVCGFFKRQRRKIMTHSQPPTDVGN
ncbi:hypothetical protein FW755_02130 [Lonepinella koalarum]|nr:hypothetical protein FW755_02130 [Lonepinella koalarum]